MASAEYRIVVGGPTHPLRNVRIRPCKITTFSRIYIGREEYLGIVCFLFAGYNIKRVSSCELVLVLRISYTYPHDAFD